MGRLWITPQRLKLYNMFKHCFQGAPGATTKYPNTYSLMTHAIAIPPPQLVGVGSGMTRRSCLHGVPMGDGPMALLCLTHGRALWLVALGVGHHALGLHRVAKLLKSRLSASTLRRIKNLDTAFAVMRHVTEDGREALLERLSQEIAAPCMPGTCGWRADDGLNDTRASLAKNADEMGESTNKDKDDTYEMDCATDSEIGFPVSECHTGCTYYYMGGDGEDKGNGSMDKDSGSKGEDNDSEFARDGENDCED